MKKKKGKKVIDVIASLKSSQRGRFEQFLRQSQSKSKGKEEKKREVLKVLDRIYQFIDSENGEWPELRDYQDWLGRPVSDAELRSHFSSLVKSWEDFVTAIAHEGKPFFKYQAILEHFNARNAISQFDSYLNKALQDLEKEKWGEEYFYARYYLEELTLAHHFQLEDRSLEPPYVECIDWWDLAFVARKLKLLVLYFNQETLRGRRLRRKPYKKFLKLFKSAYLDHPYIKLNLTFLEWLIGKKEEKEVALGKFYPLFEKHRERFSKGDQKDFITMIINFGIARINSRPSEHPSSKYLDIYFSEILGGHLEGSRGCLSPTHLKNFVSQGLFLAEQETTPKKETRLAYLKVKEVVEKYQASLAKAYPINGKHCLILVRGLMAFYLEKFAECKACMRQIKDAKSDIYFRIDARVYYLLSEFFLTREEREIGNYMSNLIKSTHQYFHRIKSDKVGEDQMKRYLSFINLFGRFYTKFTDPNLDTESIRKLRLEVEQIPFLPGRAFLVRQIKDLEDR